jgi:XTP/dITP diphosphohydrolase
MWPRLVVASRNPGKIREIRQVLAPLGMAVVGLDEIGFAAELQEKGQSFAENAAAKALVVAAATGELVLADDSGLMVDALGGRPGVLSARYGGPGLDDAARNGLLLRQLVEVPHGRRGAEFICVLALAGPAARGSQAPSSLPGEEGIGVLDIWAGRVRGVIAAAPRGCRGFGYDPVFLYLPAGKTFGEMTPEEKNAVSHRGRAVRRLPQRLARLGW